MINIRAMIQESYQCAGVLDDLTAVEGNDANLGLVTLNEILAQLNIEQLFPFQQTVYEHAGVTSALSFTIGATATIATERPSFINRIYYQYNPQTVPLNVAQMSMASVIGFRVPTGTGRPCYFGYNPQYPDGLITFDVAPMAGSTIIIVYTKAIPQVTINDVVSIPIEYNELIKYALARKLAQRKMMPEGVIQNCDVMYKECKKRIETMNGRGQVPLFYSGVNDITRNNILMGANW